MARKSEYESGTVIYLDKFPEPDFLCKVCLKPATAICSKCKHTRYCSQGCQKIDWPEHKKHCDIVAGWREPSQSGSKMSHEPVKNEHGY